LCIQRNTLLCLLSVPTRAQSLAGPDPEYPSLFFFDSSRRINVDTETLDWVIPPYRGYCEIEGYWEATDRSESELGGLLPDPESSRLWEPPGDPEYSRLQYPPPPRAGGMKCPFCGHPIPKGTSYQAVLDTVAISSAKQDRDLIRDQRRVLRTLSIMLILSLATIVAWAFYELLR
jgi:hypothetical protein